MNPLFTITANATTRKITATTGIVAVGEKVDVQISGLTESDIPWIDDSDHTKGRSLRLRIVDTNGRDVARFPLAATDVWTVSSNVFTANINLDTEVLRCAFCGAAYNAKMDFGIILDSYVDSMEYARGRLYIQQWSQCPTEDPTVMPDWLSTLAQLKADIATVDASKIAAAASATAAAASATLAGTKVTLAEAYAIAAETAKGAAVNAKNSASASATAASISASHYPYLDANGHWKVWENGAWVDKGSAKGDKGDTGDVSQVLAGETMSANPTQRQMAAALKSIWLKLGGSVLMAFLAICLFGDVTRDTEWQDVPPETKIGAVVDLGQGGGDANAVTNIFTNGVSAVVEKVASITIPSTNDLASKPYVRNAIWTNEVNQLWRELALEVKTYLRDETNDRYYKLFADATDGDVTAAIDTNGVEYVTIADRYYKRYANEYLINVNSFAIKLIPEDFSNEVYTLDVYIRSRPYENVIIHWGDGAITTYPIGSISSNSSVLVQHNYVKSSNSPVNYLVCINSGAYRFYAGGNDVEMKKKVKSFISLANTLIDTTSSFSGFTRLEGGIGFPKIPDSVTSMNHAFTNTRFLKPTKIPRIGANVKDVRACFYGLSGVIPFDGATVQTMCPDSATSHTNCYTLAPIGIRNLAYSSWGGTIPDPE